MGESNWIAWFLAAVTSIEESAQFSTRIFPALEPWRHNSMNTVIQGRKRAETKMQDCLLLFPDMVTQQVEWSQKGVLPTGYLWWFWIWVSTAFPVSFSRTTFAIDYLGLLVAPSAWYHQLRGLGKRLYSFAIAHQYGPSISSNQSLILNNTNRYFYRNSHSISYKPWIFRDSPFLLALTAPRYVAKTSVFLSRIVTDLPS